MKYFCCSSLIIFRIIFPFPMVSQESRFFMPVEIQRAYSKGTRSFDGKPGSNYWQNTADYNIKVEVFPSERFIDGIERIVYHNNSPDDINKVVVRLYADAYKRGNLRLQLIDEKDINDGVKIKEVSVDGILYDLEDPLTTKRNGTNICFQLKRPLKPGSSLNLTVSWRQKIPGFSKIRTGVYDGTSLFIAYWYPQIAVYDDIFGWDETDYLFNTEFYNNLADFEVEINVPQNYVVWATGTLTNASEVLPKEIFEKYQLARISEKETQILTVSDINNGFISPIGTWHYTAKEVPDFAFAVSDHHIWDAAVQKIKDRSVFINSVRPLNYADEESEHLSVQLKAILYFTSVQKIFFKTFVNY